MKKIKAVVLAVALMCGSYTNANAALEMKLNSAALEFEVSGTAEKGREAVLTEIQPFTDYTDTYDFLTAEKLASGTINAIMRTKLSEQNGEFDMKIGLSEIADGRYVYKVHTYGLDKKGLLLILTDGVFSDAVKAEMNSGDTERIKNALIGLTVIDDGNSSQEKYEYLSQCIRNMMPATGYTKDSFVDAYMTAEGLYNTSVNVMSFENMLDFYSLAFDTDYVKVFEEMDSVTQTAVEKLFTSNVPQREFSKEFTDNAFAAKCYSADSSATLKGLIVSYAQQNVVSLEQYESLSDIGKENVFIYMYNNQKDLISASKIISNFNDAVSGTIGSGGVSDSADRYDGGGGGGGGYSAPTASGTNNQYTPSATTAPTEDPSTGTDTFKDISGHWAEKEIKEMMDMGLINGYDDGTFKPDGYIKRAEFVKILCDVFNLNGVSDIKFSDVPENAWYKDYIYRAASEGVIEGYDGVFKPEDNISRQDAAVIIKRCIDKTNAEMDNSEVNYNDYDDVADYAKEAICVLTNAGIMNGSGGNINPKANITRAEATVVILRCLGILS